MSASEIILRIISIQKCWNLWKIIAYDHQLTNWQHLNIKTSSIRCYLGIKKPISGLTLMVFYDQWKIQSHFFLMKPNTNSKQKYSMRHKYLSNYESLYFEHNEEWGFIDEWNLWNILILFLIEWINVIFLVIRSRDSKVIQMLLFTFFFYIIYYLLQYSNDCDSLDYSIFMSSFMMTTFGFLERLLS